jgi:rod shape-determining protein MreD
LRAAAYFILVYFAVGLQLGLSGMATVKGVGPNLLLPVVVFLGLHLHRQPAVLGSFFAGLMQDLTSMQPPGLYAVSYLLSALVISRVAESVRRGHVLTWLAMTLLAGGITGILQLLHDVFRSSADGVRVGPRTVVVSVVYSAVVAPAVIWTLRQVNRMLGPEQGRRGHRV